MLAVLVVCTAAVAGGALALKPALGPFGIHFILDQVKRGEHERLLTQLVAEGQKGMDADTLEAARAVLGSFDAARQQAPRFEPLAARAAFAHYAAALRFGPLPKLEAAGKIASDQLDPKSDAAGHRLARAAGAVVARDPEAKRMLESLGADPDARQLLAELALANAEWERAAQIWAELASASPGSARAAYGLGQAQLGLGKAAEALAQVQRVLSINPKHVGAHVLRLEAHRALRDSSGKDAGGSGTESLVEAVKGALAQASPGEAALAHSVLGELHLSQGRSGPAQHSFEESLAMDRNFPRALVGLGETLHLAGRHAEALARFEAAAHIKPISLHAELGMAKSQIQLARVPEAKVILARLQEAHKTRPEVIYWMAKAEQALGAHDAALLAYRSAIELGKGRADSVDAYLALAKLQSELGQLAAAQQTLSEARDRLPPSGPLHRALGEIAMNRAEYAEGYAQFQKALLLEAGDTRARFLGAVALTRLGRFEEALAAFQSVSETDKDFPGLAIERGRLFEESGRNEEALKEYEAAFVKTPDDVDLQIRVGCGRVVGGQSAAAEKLLETVLKARPRAAEAHHCLGRALFEQDRFVDSIQRLERAVSLDSTRAVYHLYVGWVAGEVGRHGDAESALEKALELDKGLADAYWQRGRLRLKQGAVKDAIRDLDRALELKPSRHEARADLAVAYADLGRMPQALSHWEDAIARDADNPTWHFRYGKLLSSAGNGAQAVAHLKRAVDLLTGSAGAMPGATQPKPPIWLWQAHYLLGRELGLVGAAIPHWQAYLRLSPADDPYRPEAERALETLGQPWDPR
jgi:tetratricopeptide (TPR) repeat protein